MPAPLIGAAAAVAARVVAKKLATKTAKKVVKKVAEPKSAVKVVRGTDGKTNMDKNATTDIMTQLRKSGEVAKITALRSTGKPNTTVKINSGNTVKKAAAKPKAKSYWELKGLPSLVKVNSGKGNTTVSPLTYRGKAPKATAPKKATGRRGQ
jgi:curli biogenesis system outer membrane secretion channel CsgG